MPRSRVTPLPDDGTRCPKCGSGRLVRRRVVIEGPRPWRDLSLVASLRGLLTGRRPRSLARRAYVCELCGARWSVDETPEPRSL